MNIQQPVSNIMSASLITLSPTDQLLAAKEIFGTDPLHHIPIVERDKLVGILSKSDYLYFLKPIDSESKAAYANNLNLKNYTIQDAMTKRVVSISSTDSVHTALEILSENLFHALPVVDHGKLKGIVTTHDIIYGLLHTEKMYT